MAIGISRAKLLIGVLLALLIYLPVVSPCFAADEAAEKVQTLRQAGQQLLDVGNEQYRRGMYDDARQTLGKAAAYKQYLSTSDVNKLDELLEKLNMQPSQEVQPVRQNDSEIAVLEEAQPEQQELSGQPTVNPEYIEFISVEPNDIDQIAQTPMPVEQVESLPEFITPVPAEQELGVETYQPQTQIPVAAEKAKEDYIEVVKQKQRIQQSYTKAVVNEAIAKAKEYTDKEDFIQAKDEIARATSTIEKNKLLLEDTDYAQYRASLQQLSDEIETRQIEADHLKTETAKTEAQAAQEKLRSQQTADRQRRIEDLMTHAREYQEQQDYEQALAQIETLLLLDPLNREALRSKQMLEDIINLRRQIEVKKEIGREEQNVFYDTQKSMIPHAEYMTYPKDWRDITAKRKPTLITGLPPTDVAVHEQLNNLVDLSALTPDTPFDEAIEVIKTSVEPPLKIIVRWKDLEENAYIEPDTVIGMQGLAGIPLGKALRELLSTVSGGIADIGFVIEDGIITIATRESLPSQQVTHVYDITELIGRPANYWTDLQVGEDVGSSGGGGSESAAGEEEEIESTAETVILMIQDTIEPMSWLINGGNGTISAHGKRLVVSQTPEIHEKIQKLLTEGLRESLGQQVSIEARFLFVTENFLEDIGFGINQMTVPQGKIHDKLGTMIFDFGSAGGVAPEETSIPGTIAPTLLGAEAILPAVELFGGVTYGSILDDLTVSFFLRAVQMHRDAKTLTAPRVTVLSGESAYIRVDKREFYIENYEFEDITAAGEAQAGRVLATPQNTEIIGGVTLNITPIISADKKYVTLDISTSYAKVDLGEYAPVYDPQGKSYNIQLPKVQSAVIQTRVSVPDEGTLLIGGQKLSAEINKESGVPVLSKVPLLGRLFSSRSKVKDQDVLLILVKPKIILQKEAEDEYFAPLE